MLNSKVIIYLDARPKFCVQISKATSGLVNSTGAVTDFKSLEYV